MIGGTVRIRSFRYDRKFPETHVNVDEVKQHLRQIYPGIEFLQSFQMEPTIDR